MSVSRPPTPEGREKAERTVVLVGDEVDALAQRLVARLVSDWAEHVGWEDLPHLDETSWEQVAAEMDDAAVDLLRRSDALDRACGVDSRFLLEQSS